MGKLFEMQQKKIGPLNSYRTILWVHLSGKRVKTELISIHLLRQPVSSYPENNVKEKNKLKLKLNFEFCQCFKSF